MAAASGTAGKKGKGKMPKRFLESQDTLELALSIAELQESKSKSKFSRRHTQLVRPESTRTEKKSSKSKLVRSEIFLLFLPDDQSRVQKEKKAILAAERAKHKKEKAKYRKQIASQTCTGSTTISNDQKEQPSTDRSMPRKRVSFA
ncbi:uncharacterized protein BT62DRAFT_1070847 [Guyanagaster necrorhizus]|uniref:Uncharacterized protein n=1 Tax=Guyanagaster necrorhizus TaxID=856835 RepID=A0A9P7W6Q9_9AGAR|nr:uncharacterized protein BT62DRAFT_1070847 [Guyanagaster necrorhizus MCA 3950]KAG7453192.1 hypothetical protein BT62DRAFT_1070847 [Guyanagaster necrorhizus MCA 3950]